MIDSPSPEKAALYQNHEPSQKGSRGKSEKVSARHIRAGNTLTCSLLFLETPSSAVRVVPFSHPRFHGGNAGGVYAFLSGDPHQDGADGRILVLRV